MSQDALEILQELIKYKSITPNHAGSLDYLAELLAEQGFTVEYVELGDGAQRTANLYARIGNTKPHFCFAGHVDVVAPGPIENWNADPFEPLIEGDRLTGRGSVDMKGAIAAMVAASSKLLSSGTIEGSISFLLTADEEGAATYGTKAMLQYLDKRFDADFCLVGEPTSINTLGDTVKIGRRGSANYVLEVLGTQGHTAYPHLAENPIQNFSAILTNLVTLELDKGSKFFDASNLEVTSIDVGNNTSNVIPHLVKCNFNIRYNDLHNAQSLETKLRELIEAYTKKYTLKYDSSCDAFLSGENTYTELVCSAVEELLGLRPNYKTNGGTSDARFIKDYCSVAELGFLSDTAHKINEHVKISDLQKLRDVYYLVLEKFFL